MNPVKRSSSWGGSGLNHLVNRFPIETVSGTFGSVLQQFTYYPWAKPDPARGEAGVDLSMSVQQIARVDPDVILVQSFALRATTAVAAVPSQSRLESAQGGADRSGL